MATNKKSVSQQRKEKRLAKDMKHNILDEVVESHRNVSITHLSLIKALKQLHVEISAVTDTEQRAKHIDVYMSLQKGVFDIKESIDVVSGELSGLTCLSSNRAEDTSIASKILLDLSTIIENIEMINGNIMITSQVIEEGKKDVG